MLTEVEECVVANPSQLNTVLDILKNHELCKNVAEKIQLDIAYGNRGMTKKLGYIYTKWQ